MVNSHFLKQEYFNAGPLTLGYFCTKRDKQALYIAPGNIGANWAGKEAFQCFVVFALHSKKVLCSSTMIECISISAGVAWLPTEIYSERVKGLEKHQLLNVWTFASTM